MERLEAGDKFGETAFISSLTSTASVVVASQTLEVLAISRQAIMEMYQQNPNLETGLFCYIAQQLAARFIQRQNVVHGLRGSMQFVNKRMDDTRQAQIRWKNGVIDDSNQPELVVQHPKYNIEFGNFNVPQKDRTCQVDEIERDYNIFATDFINRKHFSLIGYSLLEEQFVAISICLKQYMEDVKVIVIVRRVSDVSTTKLILHKT